jgi:hypothetical protein
MRHYTLIVRVSVLTALVLAAVLCGGWKWDLGLH